LLVASAYGSGIFRGDFLKPVDDGTYAVAGAGDSISHLCLGAANYVLADGTTRCGTFLPTGTTYTGSADITNPLASKVLAIPVHGQVFEMDAATALASLAAAQTLVGNVADIVATAAGSTFNGMSGFELAVAGATAGGSAQMKILEIARYGKDNNSMNDVTAAKSKFLVEVYEEATIYI
jgi:hypothetical protein